MKKLLTIAALSGFQGEICAPCEEIEIIRVDEKPFYEVLKQVKSKYVCVADGGFAFSDSTEYLSELDGATADIVVFEGGCLIKTAILKGLPAKLCADRFTAEVFGAMDAKSVLNADFKPLNLYPVAPEYSPETEERLYDALAEFKKCKAKLSKEVYSFVFDAFLKKLITFYICAAVAIREKQLEAEKLKEFDAKLKENIVLYLALEKKFYPADIKKLREKDFKIGFIQYNKFKKLIK